jgi:hypothetical protein
MNFSPLLQTTLSFNPKLFNGALNEQLVAHQQRSYQNAQIKQQPQQMVGHSNQNTSMSGIVTNNLANQQKGTFPVQNGKQYCILIGIGVITIKY